MRLRNVAVAFILTIGIVIANQYAVAAINIDLSLSPYGLYAMETSTGHPPELYWQYDGSNSVRWFNVYRNNQFIGQATYTRFIDVNLNSPGIYTYKVTAIGDNGETLTSNEAVVNYGSQGLNIGWSMSSRAYNSGSSYDEWYNTPVTATFYVNGQLDESCPPITIDTEGQALASCSSSQGTLTLPAKFDGIAPIASNLQASYTSMKDKGVTYYNITATVDIEDNLSGFQGLYKAGEMYIDNLTSPGSGYGFGVHSTTGEFKVTWNHLPLSKGLHTVYIRPLDLAGNWGSVVSTTINLK